MQWYEFVFTLIDMRSFSNLWFWVMLAVQWSMTSHWVMGIPFDMVLRARRKGGVAVEDLEQIARINANRLLHIVQVSGMWITGLMAFGLTLLAMLGFYHHVEFAQAVFCLVFPMALIFGLSIHTAHRVIALSPKGEALERTLIHLRLKTQGIGMLAIFVTSIWGMYQNMHIGVFG